MASESCHDQACLLLLGDVGKAEKVSSVAGVLVRCFSHVVYAPSLVAPFVAEVFFYRDECEVPERSPRHIIFVRPHMLLLHEAFSIHRRLGRSWFPCCVEQVRLVRLIISLLGGEPRGTVTQKSG